MATDAPEESWAADKNITIRGEDCWIMLDINKGIMIYDKKQGIDESTPLSSYPISWSKIADKPSSFPTSWDKITNKPGWNLSSEEGTVYIYNAPFGNASLRTILVVVEQGSVAGSSSNVYYLNASGTWTAAPSTWASYSTRLF